MNRCCNNGRIVTWLKSGACNMASWSTTRRQSCTEPSANARYWFLNNFRCIHMVVFSAWCSAVGVFHHFSVWNATGQARIYQTWKQGLVKRVKWFSHKEEEIITYCRWRLVGGGWNRYEWKLEFSAGRLLVNYCLARKLECHEHKLLLAPCTGLELGTGVESLGASAY